MYAFCKHEANLDLITTANSLQFEMFFVKCFGLRAQYEHRKMKFWYTAQTVQTLHCTDKAVDGTGYIQFRPTERNIKMTGRVTLTAGSQH